LCHKSDSTPSSTKIRHDARSVKGQAMLKIYADAVKKMKAKPEGDTRSWLFQWYTHAVKGTTTKAAEITRIFPAASPARDLATAAWETCQAHGPSDDENNFLPWHRAYIYYFEEIIRKVSGDSSFTLPYWDYSAVADPSIRGIIPPEFARSGDPVFDSLFQSNRNPGVNSGQPIHQGLPANALAPTALGECLYSPEGAQSGFNMALDFGLHGTVHVRTGNGQNMGSVPFAAGDPIFWLHHSNIDRLWASWTAAGRTSPALDVTFPFADGDGNRIDANLKNFVDINALGYSYDRLETVPACAVPAPVIADAAKAQRVAATVKATPVQLQAEPVRVTLEPVANADEVAPKPVNERVKALKAGKRLFLVVKGLRADAEPGVVYNVYFQLPEKPTDEQSKAMYVGSISFFGAAHHAGHHADNGPPKGPERFVSFDVTELAKSLATKDALPASPTITIIPAGKPADAAKPVVGDIRLVEQ
jgi:tyrosinase